jgi:hypothetical protein
VPVITDITDQCQGTLQAFPGGSIRAYAAKNGWVSGESTPVGSEAVSVNKITRFDLTSGGNVVEVDVTDDGSIVGTDLVIAGWDSSKKYHYSVITDESTSTAAGFVADVGQDFGLITRDYGALTTAWTLDDNQNKAKAIIVTNAGGAVQAIAQGYPGKRVVIQNSCGHTLTFKTSAAAGVAITNGTVREVIFLSTDFVIIT